TKKPTLFLVDGSNYMYRAFYAIRELSNSKGFPTNAIYGFTKMLMKLCRDWKPDYIAVVFDVKGPTFRNEAYDQYKATRKPMPETLIPQVPFIKDIVRGFSIPVLEKEGLEADDIIGTLAKTCAREGIKTVIVSGDKDFMQLVSDDIMMIDTMKDKTYGIEGVRERFGVDPEKVVEILGLMGDASDNIPGVPGVGEKTALRLIEEFGTVEGVLENANKVRNKKVKENLREFADQARLSRELATIKTDAEVEFDLESLRHTEPDTDILKEIFKEFEFSSLIQELKIREEEDVEKKYNLILKEGEFETLLKRLQEVREFSFNLELTSDVPMLAEIVGISICPAVAEAYYVPVAHSCEGAPEQLESDYVLESLTPLFSDGDIKKHGHDIKNSLIVLSRNGVELKGVGYDTMVASYVLNPSKHSYDLTDIVRDHLGYELVSKKELVGSGSKTIGFDAVVLEKAVAYSCRRVDAILKLSSLLSDKIEKGELGDLFYNVEMPLVKILASMEKKGVLVDAGSLKEMSLQLGKLISLSAEKIYRLAGEKFNINSPKQLQVILFDKLGLPKSKKTKDGYSTGVEVLSALARTHELPAEILAYRSIAKLKSTYIDALPMLVNPETGRIHTSYNQAVTATGRLSSSNPNLQNIPARTVEGRRIRQAFISPEDCQIVSADYSQIELRILAHLSGDEILVNAFKSNEDIHTRTASDIFGIFPEMVNEDMRRQAKVINFGVIYGMSPFGLSRELGINQKQAKAYIDAYFRRFHGVREYLDRILENARRDGFVTTLLNRRRYLPEINSSSAFLRQFAERTAVNTPIQGTAADLIKVAMLNIARCLAEGNFSASMIMQVHDELVFEVPLDEKDEIVNLVRREMEEVIELKVPLKVDISSGRNWDEAH
ncbi:MAG: DNA polymerase I, partial [Thermodesulfobacteriota bacterium]|nr:DNA polymerase I [Thermodesulfobacteriota bacterium]